MSSYFIFTDPVTGASWPISSIGQQGLATDEELSNKADTSFVNSGLSAKADNSYVDTRLALKANTAYVDSNFATKTALDLKADSSALPAKADVTYVDSTFATKTALGLKADSTALDPKADKTYVDTQLATKANSSALANVADKTYVDTQVGSSFSSINSTYQRVLHQRRLFLWYKPAKDANGLVQPFTRSINISDLGETNINPHKVTDVQLRYYIKTAGDRKGYYRSAHVLAHGEAFVDENNRLRIVISNTLPVGTEDLMIIVHYYNNPSNQLAPWDGPRPDTNYLSVNNVSDDADSNDKYVITASSGL